MTLPRPIRPFVEFPSLLRAHGFAVSPDQTMSFVEGVGLLGPRNMEDIRRAAIALLSVPRERVTEFDILFRAFFLGQSLAIPTSPTDEGDDVEAYEATGGESEAREDADTDEAGVEAVSVERLSQRRFPEAAEAQVLSRFARLAPARLPRRLSYRHTPAPRGRRLNLRRTLREAVRHDGEIFTLVRNRRKTRQRRIVLLIDISGSMKEQTDEALRFAYTLTRIADRREVFTLGTRLTRITPALGLRNRDQAMERVSQLVADFDGGTRIGDALQAFLDVPRFAGLARGAAVIVLSDGLERGSPDAMFDAVRRLSRLVWRLDWLTPLAGDAGFAPRTEALSAVLPFLDSVSDGSRIDAVCDHVLSMARAA